MLVERECQRFRPGQLAGLDILDAAGWGCGCSERRTPEGSGRYSQQGQDAAHCDRWKGPGGRAVRWLGGGAWWRREERLERGKCGDIIYGRAPLLKTDG